ncbi:hypothetical protein B9Q02_11370 [Candidatus Marsarchaeota G1 archaeon BE_D]|uniref:4,5-dihydroxyphthalate decarboxylase n=3 Tax=Candidatus Marsarchaeota group 1 TaxID=2203770 RepID=A0A2R6A8M9_9ARCH|nr:MAG: hypothetical protein B9Q02_11370 [Candidatus Marsarchaeota G1 archaeon BE_D]
MIDMKEIVFATSLTDRTLSFFVKQVELQGFRLKCHTAPVEEIFLKQARELAFDVAEFSLSSYIIMKSRGYSSLTAIPVFPSRSFRHSNIYVRADSSLESFSDLVEKRFGFPEYQMTAAVWVRALLREEGGISNDQIKWFTYRDERIPIKAPVTRGSAPDVFSGLLTNEVDAVFSARRPPAEIFSLDGKGGKIRRLLKDPWGAEKNYFLKTKIFPIMHVITIKSELLNKAPNLAKELFDLFCEAKKQAISNVLETAYLSSILPWSVKEAEETIALMGDDYWPYGLKKNAHTIKKFMEYMQKDGLIDSPLSLDELFHASTLDT